MHTAADLERLSDEGYHYELVKGELRPVSLGGGLHGAVTSRVSSHVGAVVYGDDLGLAFAAGTGFFLERDPDTVRAPDFAFVAYERLPDPLPEDYVPVAPDLAVETLSPDDTAREVAEKVEGWLAAGVRMVWVIAPYERTITTFRTGRPPQILGIDDTLDGEDVLPGLSVPVARIFPPSRN